MPLQKKIFFFVIMNTLTCSGTLNKKSELAQRTVFNESLFQFGYFIPVLAPMSIGTFLYKGVCPRYY
jgi:hypothetical protein